MCGCGRLQGLSTYLFCGISMAPIKKQGGFQQNLRYSRAFMKMIRKPSSGFYMICPAPDCGHRIG
jgi:hypothetical protein